MLTKHPPQARLERCLILQEADSGQTRRRLSPVALWPSRTARLLALPPQVLLQVLSMLLLLLLLLLLVTVAGLPGPAASPGRCIYLAFLQEGGMQLRHHEC